MRRKGARKKEEGTKVPKRPPRETYLGVDGEAVGRIKEEGKLRDLKVRTKEYALRVIRLFRALPKTEEGRVLGRQMLRSGTSVGANYREARRSRSDAEFIAKMGDCLKELDESAYWLELLSDAEVLPKARFKEIIIETDELMAIFFTIIRSRSK